MQKRARQFTASLFISLLFYAPAVLAQLQSPGDFLGYGLGERFTPHHKVAEYARHVAENSDRVAFHTYGKTYEGRELIYLVITDPQNHDRLEEIRLNNLRLAGLEEGDASDNRKGIVWLSYNVHGNEASSSEAALKTLYELANSRNSNAAAWLRDLVVIMDPMLNPDGRERYVNWFRSVLGAQVNADVHAREHREPWPGGRSNHYYFDLNRDWAWQTQAETKQRIPVYQQWMPHIHVDFHEQGYNSPYYFAPAAEPFHEAITDWQRDFQTTIGENHIRYFDENGWLYFTREQFDLFYPSYGDTWPTFNGSVGMTYEQAGHSMAGLAVEKAEGDTLTLEQRLTRHYTTGISTIETAAQNAEQMIREFRDYFARAAEGAPGERYRTFVIHSENNPDKIYHLLSYLDSQQVQYGVAGSDRVTDGFNYATGESGRVSIRSGDIVISVRQPQSQLTRVLFEPDPALADSLTYDITSWETHYRFGLEGYALEEDIHPDYSVAASDFRTGQVDGPEQPYAYLLRWASMDDARFLADITRQNVRARFSEKPFEVNGERFARGTLVITRNNNGHLNGEFDRIIRDAAQTHNRTVLAMDTGHLPGGYDFGSGNFRFIEQPDIAVVAGEGTSSLNTGEIWHYFDRQLKYPATMIDSRDLMRIDLNRFNVLILPSGNYRNILDDPAIEKISSWVQQGGALIAFGQANAILAERNGFQLQRKMNPDEEPDLESKLQPYEERRRNYTSSTTPGSVFNITMDTTHPLAFGYAPKYFSLKTGADAYEYLDSGWNAGTARPGAHRSGFAGYEAKQKLEHTLAFGVQSHGSGQVVYMIDNPLFRGFWENGKLLVANAVFFVGN